MDIRDNYGGNWLEHYDYVRLHQPYRNFTSYNEPWKFKKRPEYLASRDEVVEHLQHIGKKAEAKHGTKSLFKYRYIDHKNMRRLLRSVFSPLKMRKLITPHSYRIRC